MSAILTTWGNIPMAIRKKKGADFPFLVAKWQMHFLRFINEPAFLFEIPCLVADREGGLGAWNFVPMYCPVFLISQDE